MKFCCDVFDGMVDSAGNAGFSIVAKDFGSVKAFCLQGRAVDVDQEAKIQHLRNITDVPRPLLVVFQQCIRHCPFCGTLLETIIAQSPEMITCLVDDQRSLVM